MEAEMEDSIDLLELWRIIRKRWLIVVTLPMVALITSGILSFFIIPPVYQATAMVIVGKKADTQVDKAVDYSSIMANQQLAKTYETIAKSRTVLERVANQVGSNLTPERLSNEVSVGAVKATEVIAINVSDQDPELAAKIANALTIEFSNRVIEVKKVDSVGVIDSAVVPVSPIKPNKKLNMALAFVLGLFTAVGLVFLLEFLDNTVKTADQVEELTGLTVLGTIPKFQTAK
jgi:capsular polysaccharide biosynthesis protein